MQPSIIRKNEIMRSQSVHNEEMIDVIYYYFLICLLIIALNNYVYNITKTNKKKKHFNKRHWQSTAKLIVKLLQGEKKS